MGDIFSHIFGGRGGPSSGPPPKRKAKSVLHLLEVSLADVLVSAYFKIKSQVYKGCHKKMKISRDRVCKECEGRGGKGDSVIQCTKCNGMGKVIKTVSSGFMMTQTIAHCDSCRGRGKIIKDKCKKCSGNGVVTDVKIQDIELEKGTPDGHRYVFKGEADEYVGFYVF